MKRIDHKRYPEQLKTKTLQELAFIISDSTEAADLNPQGENTSYYLDEAIYAGEEIKRRRDVQINKDKIKQVKSFKKMEEVRI